MTRTFVILGLGLSSCTEYEYTSKTQKDVFQQSRRNTVDILLVVDDSCSMAEEQAKLANNFESFIAAFQGIDVDWQIGVTTTDTYRTDHPGRLLGGDDEVILEDQNGRAISTVRWDRTWNYGEGASMQLSIDSYSATATAIKDNWCVSTESYGDGDSGTPGQSNRSCSQGFPSLDTASASDSGVEDTGSSEPASEPSSEPEEGDEAIQAAVGDIIITEIMMDPLAVSDELGEWIEVQNLTDNTLDISGYRLSDDGKNLYVIPDDVFVGPQEALVIGRSGDNGQNGGVDVDLVSSGITLNNKTFVLKPEHEDAKEIFEEMVVVGTTGSGIEMGLEAAKLALSEPLLSGENSGFLRSEANLSLIFISDEDDFSPQSTASYQRFFTELKGEEAYRERSRMRISAVVGKTIPPYEEAPSCESENGIGYFGPRYIELASKTEGALESICDDDFSPIAEELGLLASGLEVSFELSALPDIETLAVKLYAEESDDSFIRELVKDEEFFYVIDNNTITFDINALPASETYIVAEYRVLPGSAEIVDEEESSE